VLSPDISARALEQTARSHRSVAECHEWDGETFWLMLQEGDANAGLQCRGAVLSVDSAWLNRDPQPAVLQRSLELQAEVIDIMRARFPGVPPMDRWQVEWYHLEAQQADAAGRPQAAGG
jgi:hypothetical protein